MRAPGFSAAARFSIADLLVLAARDSSGLRELQDKASRVARGPNIPRVRPRAVSRGRVHRVALRAEGRDSASAQGLVVLARAAALVRVREDSLPVARRLPARRRARHAVHQPPRAAAAAISNIRRPRKAR